MEFKIITKSKEETIKLGEFIGKFLKKGNVITLEGDLGAGKTTFVKGVGKSLNVIDDINSPTFNILKCYFSKPLPLYHIDAYRLEDVNPENKNIGLEEVIEGNGVCLIEWPMFISEFLQFSNILKVVIKNIKNDNREISIFSESEIYKDIFKSLGNFKNE